MILAILPNLNPDTVLFLFMKRRYEGKQPLTFAETVTALMNWQTNGVKQLHLFHSKSESRQG